MCEHGALCIEIKQSRWTGWRPYIHPFSLSQASDRNQAIPLDGMETQFQVVVAATPAPYRNQAIPLDGMETYAIRALCLAWPR